jgi:activator of HSP90 ATPase
MEFTVKTKLKASAEEIYLTWLSSKGHSLMTGGEATITDKVGDDFTTWDGYIKGKNIALEPYNKIVQSWRSVEFNKNEEDSQIEVIFEEYNGETEITLIHSNIFRNIDNYKIAWYDYYFKPMKEYFSK